MTNDLDMSLDDIIRKRKRKERDDEIFEGSGQGFDIGQGSGIGHGSGVGPDRPVQYGNAPGMTLYPTPMESSMVQTPMPRPAPAASYARNPEGGTMLYISNLDYRVSDRDIMTLFSDVGYLKGHGIHYDMHGRSKGTAEVVFVRQSDAVAAIRRYNNHLLDGRPMKIEVVGASLVHPVHPIPQPSRIRSSNDDFERRRAGQVPAVVGDNDGRRHARDRGIGRRSHENPNPTAEELDADLEDYHHHAAKRSSRRT